MIVHRLISAASFQLYQIVVYSAALLFRDVLFVTLMRVWNVIVIVDVVDLKSLLGEHTRHVRLARCP
jgi:hypothetical protein